MISSRAVYSSSNLEQKLGASYKPTVFVALIILVFSVFSLIHAEELVSRSISAQIRADSVIVTVDLPGLSKPPSTDAQTRAIESARRAVTTLTIAVVVITAIAVGAVVYLNSHLVRTKRALQKQHESIEEMNVARDRFISSATHELNTPLTVTTALVDALAKNPDGNLSERQLRQIAAVQRNNRHLKSMVDGMIRSAVAGDVTESQTRPINYSEFVSRTLESMRSDMYLQGVDIQWSVSKKADMVRIDTDRIHQALTNLLANASQNSPSGAIVFVSTERVGSNILTCIRDFGPGIPVQDRPHVFSAFYRADTETNRRVRGAGLGLTLVKQVIEGHGGTVGFDSNEEEAGVTFCFTLPIDE